MFQEIIDKCVLLMQNILSNFVNDIDKIKAGRANTKIISSIKIFYCGNEVSLGHISTISVFDTNVIMLTPFDKQSLVDIDKEIRSKGFNSIMSRDSLKIIFPHLSLEERQKLIKYIFSEAELNKVSIRNIRRDMKNNLQVLLKNKNLTLDEEKIAMKSIQKITDKFIDEIDVIVKNKEKEILNI